MIYFMIGYPTHYHIRKTRIAVTPETLRGTRKGHAPRSNQSQEPAQHAGFARMRLAVENLKVRFPPKKEK